MFGSVECESYITRIMCHVTECSIQCHADSAYEEYADAYHWSVHMQTSAYGHFNDMRLYIYHMQSLHNSAYYMLSRSDLNNLPWIVTVFLQYSIQ